MRSRVVVLVTWFWAALACGGTSQHPVAPAASAVHTVVLSAAPHRVDPPSQAAACGSGKLSVAFLDAGQALAVLVTLPDNKHILVDTGEAANRPGCGAPCKEWHDSVISGLSKGLDGAPIDLLWITHQHADHIGGAVDVLDHFAVNRYVDNGRDPGKPTIRRTHDALEAHDIPATVIDPEHTAIPLATADDVKLTAIVPPHWYPECDSNPNVCSIALRIDYCSSSILFTGDAEELEEADLAIGAPVTLFQVGHHGSNTSSSAALLDQARPRYAVISAGKAGEGTNRTYCHPRQEAVDALTEVLGGAGEFTIHAFPSTKKCSRTTPDAQWVEAPASDHLWVTARDGEIVLTTTGDGEFTRE